MRKSILFVILFGIAFSSCKPPDHDDTTNMDSVETLQSFTSDSDMRMGTDSAWNVAHAHRKDKTFDEALEWVNGGDTLKTRVTIGNFLGNRKCLIVRESLPLYNGVKSPVHLISIYYYSPGHDSFMPATSYVDELPKYIGDTIQDVNDDGRKDFIGYYRTSLKGIGKRYAVVKLATSDTSFHTTTYYLGNPNFFSREKIVRGVMLDESCRSEIYKYRWNNFQVDTLEYIYHDNETPGQFIKSKYLPVDKRNTQEQQVKLKSLPAEYSKLRELDWFMGTPDDLN